MTSSHPITASTPEGSSYGAIGTVSSRTWGTAKRLPGAGESTLKCFKARKNKAAIWFRSSLQLLGKKKIQLGKFRLQFKAKHLHQQGGKSLEEVPRDPLSLEMFLSTRQSHSHLISVGDNAA